MPSKLRHSDADKSRKQRSPVLRGAVEVGFIIFLFYSNLLMSEYTRHARPHNGLLNAMHDVVTPENAAIALITGLIGYAAFEFLRRRLY